MWYTVHLLVGAPWLVNVAQGPPWLVRLSSGHHQEAVALGTMHTTHQLPLTLSLKQTITPDPKLNEQPPYVWHTIAPGLRA